MKRKALAVILATTITVGYLPVETLASEGVEIENTIEKRSKNYKEGTYTVENKVYKIDADSNSAARNYVDNQSIVKISGNSITTTIDFTEKKLMSNIKIKVNGQSVDYKSTDIDEKKLRLELSLNSLDDKIEVSSTINTGFFKMDVSFRVVLDKSSIPLAPEESPETKPEENPEIKPEEKPETDSEEKPENKPEGDEDYVEEENNGGKEENVTEGMNKPTGGNVNNGDTSNITTPSTAPQQPQISVDKESKIYKIKNEIITSSAIGYSAARASVNNISYLEEINGEKYITLGLSQLNLMNNIRLTVDGKKVNYEVVRKDDSKHAMDIRFKVSSINSDVKITAYIEMTSMDISFGIDFLENTMELISKSEASKSLGSSNAGKTLEISAAKERSAEEGENSEEKIDEETKTEIPEAKEYFKKYTIENDIVSNSSMGKLMTRKYLDKISILEEIDGKFYLTLKFSGTTAMENIKIKVNGIETKYEVIASNEDEGVKAFRFEISNIKDDIRVYMFIKPVKMNIDFGVTLLEESKKLIEEGVISEENKVDSSNKLLNTLVNSNNNGGISQSKIIGTTVAVTVPLVLLIEGIITLIRRKVKKNK
ncbi:NEAT domain-containing protein [Clostridium massiliamazoniense]|uniref:NEAT domain-containing protein n=1 Tax=Clostridium massiliamazoniense TaxID=1347366 RepID=UPI0006D856F0|nr:NEAT domain-containing protein [Clostridium massiliamazoniense]